MRFKKSTFGVHKVHFLGVHTSPKLILATGLIRHNSCVKQVYFFIFVFVCLFV